MNNSTGQEEPTEKFFPKDPISDSNIIIVRLQPNPSGNSERLAFTGTARAGNGSIDAGILLLSASTQILLTKSSQIPHLKHLNKMLIHHSVLNK